MSDFSELCKDRFKLLTYYGLKNGDVKKIDDEILEKLSNIYIGNVPSIMFLFDDNYSTIFSDRTILFSLALEGTKSIYVRAEADSITCPNGENKNIEYYERKMDDGSVWIYDLQTNLMYDKEFYYMLRHPRKIKNFPLSYIEYFPFNYETDIEKAEQKFSLRKLGVTNSSYYYEELKKVY